VVGGLGIQPSYAGLSPGSVGLYQVNIPLPPNIGRGQSVPVTIQFPEGAISNTVYIGIE
jgi:uncharacterized protein (TIGR03437 family)